MAQRDRLLDVSCRLSVHLRLPAGLRRSHPRSLCAAGMGRLLLHEGVHGISCVVHSPKLPAENARAKKIIVDGETLDSNFLPYDMIRGKKSVEIEIVY